MRHCFPLPKEITDTIFTSTLRETHETVPYCCTYNWITYSCTEERNSKIGKVFTFSKPRDMGDHQGTQVSYRKMIVLTFTCDPALLPVQSAKTNHSESTNLMAECNKRFSLTSDNIANHILLYCSLHLTARPVVTRLKNFTYVPFFSFL
jgi:hypothetical protein